MKTTRTFRFSGLVVLGGALLAAVPLDGVRALGVVLLVFGIPLFAFSATRHLLRGLLWRVGSRLAVSYLLLPSAVVFAAFFVYAGLLVIAGQLGTRRVEAALEKRRASLAELAHDLAPRLETARDAGRAGPGVRRGGGLVAGRRPRSGWSGSRRAGPSRRPEPRPPRPSLRGPG